jgi:hypothetical protein
MDKKELSRREFLQVAATAGGAVLAGSSLLSITSVHVLRKPAGACGILQEGCN